MSTRNTRPDPPMDPAVRNEILLIVMAAFALILFLCNFGLVGKAGDVISGVMLVFLVFWLMWRPLLFF